MRQQNLEVLGKTADLNEFLFGSEAFSATNRKVFSSRGFRANGPATVKPIQVSLVELVAYPNQLPTSCQPSQHNTRGDCNHGHLQPTPLRAPFGALLQRIHGRTLHFPSTYARNAILRVGPIWISRQFDDLPFHSFVFP